MPEVNGYEPMTSLLFHLACASLGEKWVLDIGANIGHFAMIAARLDKHVMAFEPRASAYALLQSNLEYADLACVTHRKAIAKDASQRRLYYAPERKFTASLNPATWRTHSELIETASIDGVFSLMVSRPVGVIKVDVEGAEAEVIEGAQKTIKRDRPSIFLEVLNDASADAITAALPIPYTFHRIFEEEMRLESRQSLHIQEGWGNFMLLPITT